MKYWTEYTGHDPQCIKKLDNTIYTFDIESTSYLILDNQILPANAYEELDQKDKDRSIKQATMYIWQLSINADVYYGRTWNELSQFLTLIESYSPKKKIIFVHNLSFEFQFLRTQFKIKSVTSRKSRKVMQAELEDYNITFRCSLYMTNCSLEHLPKLFNLPVAKKVGDLDYAKLRHSKTELTEKELGYCEYDCLVVYEYIKMELQTYKRVDRIPLTSTGQVRRELHEKLDKDRKYRHEVQDMYNIKPSVYNLLVQAFAGGYTHANYIYADEVLKDIDSYDETSAYPYVMCTEKFPSSIFTECKIKTVDDMLPSMAYLLKIKFHNIKCKYFNNFISASKCLNIKKHRIDNGRIIEAEEIEIVLTDVDFKFIVDTYNIEWYEIESAYCSTYKYLPIKFINFILDKYVNKTQFKGVSSKELEYAKEKSKFNSLYGMTVTNMIRDEVDYDNTFGWNERELTNTEIYDKLTDEKEKGFLNFAWGVWVTAYARNNLLRRVIDLDDKVVYCDTDSIKVYAGYDKSIFDNYNKSVADKIKNVASILNIPYEKYNPVDVKGKSHLLGEFTYEGRYDKFITQGAKKYCIEKDGEIEITVSGVPKSGAKCVTKIDDFRDDLIFDYKTTNKLTAMYNDDEIPIDILDLKGVKYKVEDKSGVCLIPCSYRLGKAYEYADLLTDNSSKRSIFNDQGI